MTMLVEVRAKWYDVLVNILECPVCFEIPKEYIYQCIIGHHICVNCRYALTKCPTCHGPFGFSRNYVAEAISVTLTDIMTSLLYPAHQINRHILKNKICVSTQTQEIFKTSIKTQTNNIFVFKEDKFTQTEKMLTLENVKTHKENKKTVCKKREGKKLPYLRVRRGNYPCCIGSCITVLPYGKMIEHIAFSHADVFYTLQERKGIFKKDIKLQYIVPKDYNFALLIKNMGLFFLNITILSTGDLTGVVYAVNNSSISKHFTFVLTIGTGEKATIYSGAVKSCRDAKKQTMKDCLYKGKVEMDQILKSNDKFNSSIIIKRSNPLEINHNHIKCE